MNITGYRAPSIMYVAAVAAIFATAPVAFGQTPANSTFDGPYHGTYSGSFAAEPATGSVAFSVANGAMTVTDPGKGAGTVDSSGAATFSGSLGMGKINCRFVGTFQPATDKQRGISASGSWSCAGMGQTGKGTWSANQK